MGNVIGPCSETVRLHNVNAKNPKDTCPPIPCVLSRNFIIPDNQCTTCTGTFSQYKTILTPSKNIGGTCNVNGTLTAVNGIENCQTKTGQGNNCFVQTLFCQGNHPNCITTPSPTVTTTPSPTVATTPSPTVATTPSPIVSKCDLVYTDNSSSFFNSRISTGYCQKDSCVCVNDQLSCRTCYVYQKGVPPKTVSSTLNLTTCRRNAVRFSNARLECV